MKTMSTSDAATYGRLFVKNRAVANRFLAKCMGQDAAMDDETVAMIKEFLSDKLSDKDHTKVCSMLDGDVEAEDTEPPPGGAARVPYCMGADDERRHSMDGLSARQRMQAADSFALKFPAMARVRIDNSGLQPPARAARYSPADTESFAASFPALAKIKVLG